MTAPVCDVASAPVAEVVAALRAGAVEMDAARAVRDRAATLYLAQPADAVALARALRAACRGASLTARAWAARCAAESSLYAGRIVAARRLYADATALWEQTGDERLLGELLVGRVHVLALAGDAAGSRALARRTETLLRRTGDAVYLAKLLLNRGNAAYHTERYQDAFDAYTAARDALAASGSEDPTWAMLTLNLAVACTNLSRLDEARDYFVQCAALCARFDLPFAAAHAQFNRSQLEARAGDYRTALLLLEEAGAVFAVQDAHDMRAAAARSQASLYLALGLADEAAVYATRAAHGFAREEMDLDAMLARLILARARLAQRDPQQARPLFDEALTYFRARRVRPRQGEVLLDLARLHAFENDLAAACRAAQRAVRIFEQAGLAAREAEARRVAADAWLARGAVSRAAQVLRPLEARRDALPLRVRAGVWATRGRTALRAGHRAAAGRALRHAAALVDAQRALLPSAEARHRALADFAPVWDDLLAWELAATTPRAARITDVIERARGRGFRDSLADGRAGLPASVAGERARLGVLTQRLEERELSRGSAAGDAETTRLRTELARCERTVLRALMHAEAHESHAGAAAARLAGVRAALAADEAALAYFVAGDRVVLVSVRHDSDAVCVLPTPARAMRATVDRVRFLLESLLVNAQAGPANLRFLRASAEAALTAVYEAVVAPALPALAGARRIVVAPHAFLHGVPFESLHDGSGYVDRHWTWTRVPTLDLLRPASRVAPASVPRVAVCGVVSDDVPAVAHEVAAVAARFPAAACRVTSHARTQDILDAVQNADIVHVSTHGAFRDDNPLFSRLHTSDGGLFLADLFGRRATPDLVVLSACQTGQIFGRGGEDAQSVADGFLAMGARQLVASRWRVSDEATAALMETFHAAYATGETRGDAAAALRAAAATVRERFDHPFYWGGFSAYGRA